jgi:hypothetical protein
LVNEIGKKVNGLHSKKEEMTFNKSMKKIFKKRTLIFATSNLIFFVLGMYAYKNEYTRDKILSVKKVFDFSISNYFDGRNANPPTLYINLSDSSYNVIKEDRNSAVELGYLSNEMKNEVPAELVWDNDTLRSKLRLKGDYPDHWSGKKWSFRINIKGYSSFNGMDKFSIQDPLTRKNLNEWYYHSLLNREGLIALRYDFIRVVINDIDKGIYAVEEAFSKELLENNDRREAPILKFDESLWISQIINGENPHLSQEDIFLTSDINVFGPKKTLKDSTKFSYYTKGKKILNDLRSNEISLDEAVDIDKAAMLFAIGDLTGSYHGLRWHNQRFYYNPILNKLELIGFDSGSGVPISDIYYNYWKYDNISSELGLSRWKDTFFKNEKFVKAYFAALIKVSSKKYLTSFNKRIMPMLEKKLNILYGESLFYDFDFKVYMSNAKVIRNKIDEYYLNKKKETSSVIIKLVDSSNTNTSIEILNNSFHGIQLIGLFDSSGTQLFSLKGQKIPKREPNQLADYFNIDVELTLDQQNNCLRKTKRIKSKRILKNCFLHYKQNKSEKREISSIEVENYRLPSKSFYPLKEIVEVRNDTIYLLENQVELNMSLIIPAGYTLYLRAGTLINLTQNAQLISYSPIYFDGSEENNIDITSTDSSGSIAILNTGGRSFLNFVNCSYLTSSSQLSTISYSGGINFYQSDVTMKNTSFNHSKSEDALNIIRSKFNLNNLSFRNIKSDAFDSDYCSGILNEAVFVNVGNDAIDFSGTKAKVKNIHISNTGDKGLSAGERSCIDAENITIIKTELGLVSKDLSLLSVSNVIIKEVKVGLLAFKKKREYGWAALHASDIEINSLKEDYLLELGSNIKVSGTSYSPNSNKVVDQLYGNRYGKSSN